MQENCTVDKISDEKNYTLLISELVARIVSLQIATDVSENDE